MAAVALTPRLQDLITRLEQASDFPEKDGALEAVQADVAAGYVSTRSLKVLQRLLVHCGEEDTLRTYLVGSQVVLPGLVVKEDKTEPTAQQIRRREYLMRRQEAREYNKMVYGTDYDPGARDVLTTGNQFASVKNQLSIGANAFVAVFAMFGVGFYLARQYTPDRTTQLTAGLVCAIGILIIEMIIFIRRATQMEQTYEKKHSVNAEAVAQMRSGALLTALSPEAIEKFQKQHEPAATAVLRGGTGGQGSASEEDVGETKEVDLAVKKDN